MVKDRNAQSPEAAEFKNAARLLQAYLEKNGISLKHGQALEALTASLGAASWRMLRTKLDASAKSGWTPGEPRWLVHAIYADNGQRFSDSYGGRTPLEAQIAAQMERLSDGGSLTRIEVSCVIDRAAGSGAAVDEESYPSEAALVLNSEAVSMLCRLAQKELGEPPRAGIAECEAYDRNMRALEFWQALCEGAENQALARELDELSQAYEPDLSEYGDEPTVFTDSRGVEDTVDVVAELRCLLALATRSLDLSKTANAQGTGVFHALQVEQLIEHFEDRLAVFVNGLSLQAT